MARSKKLFFRIASVILGVTILFQTELTAEAGSNPSYLNSFSGGIAAVLDPTDQKGAELIKTTQQNLVKTEIAVEKKEDLVMANVKSALNIREEAKTQSKKLGKLYKDCGGIVLERKDGWTKLQSGNLIGWAKDEFLLFDEEAQELANNVGNLVATVNADVLGVRVSPDAEASVAGILAKDEIVDVVNTDTEGWVCIDYDGADGYVAAEYVDVELHIDFGETMEEIRAKKAVNIGGNRNMTFSAYYTDADTLYLLAALIQCEAGGESYEGQVAVGAVVMNRVRSSAYPDTIPGVIYASGQFTPAMSGKVDRVYAEGKVRESCIKAAEEALSGVSPVGDLTHFRRNDGRDGIVIGNHVFH